MSSPQQPSALELIEQARSIIIAVSAAGIGAEQIEEDINFTFSPEVQRELLGKANECLLDAAGKVEGSA